MRPVRLETRGGIGMKMFRVVYAKPIECTGTRACGAGKITAFLGLERMKCSLRIFFGAFFQNKIDIVRFWGPDPKVRLVHTDQFGANRMTPRTFSRSHEGFSFTSLFAAVLFRDFSFPV